MHEAFIDLDELILRCRDKQAKKFIQEAVACYRAGAFRSCIVATWNAIVFDFLHKLRELELLGNGEAANLLKEFENLSSTSKLRELWQFESSIPNWAFTKFELISPVEKSDIERLFDDRSRCAHPSMTSLEEPFEATAELARYHLRSAVMHLLERPPVQGRSARVRIFQDIKSEYFPVDPELATQYLQKSPLARARFILIKDIILGLTVSLLTEELPEDERARQFSALNAVSNMYPKETREILNTNLSNIILNKVLDINWDKVIIYLGSIAAWDSLSEPCQLKAKTFMEKLDVFEISPFTKEKRVLPKSPDILVKASRITFLKESIITKLQISLKDILAIKEICKDKPFNETIINPLLRQAVPQATLKELISMRIDADPTLNELIKPRLKEEIDNGSLEELVSVISRYEDESLNRLIEPCLKEKIDNASFKELLKTKSDYMVFVDESNVELIKLFDDSLNKRIKEVAFDEIIESEYWHNLPSELLETRLRENVSPIVNKFTKSGSYMEANFNAGLLLKIADLLSAVQWKDVLEAFCNNDQIYCSFQCPNIFILLFKKSIEISGNVQPYWLAFREKLNEFNINTKEINKLKKLIDSYTI
jgi:hypothetical protein